MEGGYGESLLHWIPSHVQMVTQSACQLMKVSHFRDLSWMVSASLWNRSEPVISFRAILAMPMSCFLTSTAGNLKVLSAGRFCLGLGAGWDQPEFDHLGIPFPSAAERSGRLEAALRVGRAAWPWPDAGSFTRVPDAATAGAAPRSADRPLLLAGGEGERRTLPAAVAYADVVNWQVGVGEFARKSRVLADLCEAAGRDPASLRRTHAPNFLLFDSEREFARWRQSPDRGMSAEEVGAYIRNRGALYGTAAAIEATIEEFIDAGCGGFMVFCNSAPAVESLEQLASLPPVRRAIAHSAHHSQK
jgi:alkanesulfonate monooxygenase SsuD/methylene tetrahydromethanopterin reductase-like flavin-dependent oxidoreductase (luciferase family)